jgi:hypothetical protein
VASRNVTEVEPGRVSKIHHEEFVVIGDAVGVLVVVGNAVVVLIQAWKDAGIRLGIVRIPDLLGVGLVTEHLGIAL